MAESDTKAHHGWHRLVKSVTGWKPTEEFLPAIFAAAVIYISIYLIGQFLYQTSKRVMPSSIRCYVLDFVKTMTFCTYPFGHGIMRKFYGEPGYLGAMVPIMYLSIFTFSAGDGNPIGVWLKYFKKQISVWKCIFKTIVQVLGGFAAYRLGMFILGLELHPMCLDRLKDYYSSFCSTDLKVPNTVGFVIEFLAVVYDSWLESQVLTGNKYIDPLIKIINGGLMVVGGVHLTGMYIHPAMATGHTWGCGDTSRATHILIYWVGPMIGVWISVQVQKKFSLRQPSKPAKSKSTSSKPKEVKELNGEKSSKNGARRRFYYN